MRIHGSNLHIGAMAAFALLCFLVSRAQGMGLYAIFICAATFWGVCGLSLALLRRATARVTRRRDHRQMTVLLSTTVVSVVAGFKVSMFSLARPGMHNDADMERQAAIGLCILMGGMAMHLYSLAYAVSALGNPAAMNATVKSGHVLIRKGIYRLVRHPQYTGLLVACAGFGSIFGDPVGLAVTVVPISLAILYAINLEERTLIGQFGQEYVDYRKGTRKLIPWIF